MLGSGGRSSATPKGRPRVSQELALPVRQGVQGWLTDLERIGVRGDSPAWHRPRRTPYNCANLGSWQSRYFVFATTRWAGFCNSNLALTFSICAAWSLTIATRRETVVSN